MCYPLANYQCRKPVSNDDMPGVAFPRWKVELLKVRNGTPGNWMIEWNNNSFINIQKTTAIPQEQLQKKTG